MAKSSKQLADQLVTEQLLNRLGDSRTDYSDLKEYPVLKRLLEIAALEFIQNATDILEQQGKVNKGGLVDDLSKTDVLEADDGYEVTLGYDKKDPAAEYYDFVNKGVSGVQVGRSGTPYAFKDLRVGKKMATALLLWYRSRKNMGLREDQKFKQTKGQKKNLRALAKVNEADSLKSLAYGTAVNIKKKGIRASKFFDRAREIQFGKDFEAALGKAIAGDLSVYIRQFNSLINNEQNNKN